jgi:hypothetical protein
MAMIYIDASELTELTGQSIIVTGYFVGITGVILCYAEGNASIVLMLDTLEVLVYLAPNIVILLPIIYLLCLVLG